MPECSGTGFPTSTSSGGGCALSLLQSGARVAPFFTTLLGGRAGEHGLCARLWSQVDTTQ